MSLKRGVFLIGTQRHEAAKIYPFVITMIFG